MGKKQRPYLENLDIEKYAKQPLCGVGLNSFCIAENGDIYPCPGWQSMIIGNVNQQPLKQIWNESEAFSKLRNITHGDFPQCLKCEARNYCSMCIQRNFNENNGDMFKISKHFCEVAFLTKRLHKEYKERFQ